MVARRADRVVLMNRGVAAVGTPAEVFADPQMEELFGILPDVRRLGDAREEAAAWN